MFNSEKIDKMHNNWINPKIIIGKEAIGTYYYRRFDIENEIWDEIEKGNNILIAAPRRVGKTSVMKYLEENSRENFKLIFRNVQGIDSEDEFYKAIYELIIKCLNIFKSNKAFIKNYLKSKKITEISWSGGIVIGDNEINYLDEINNLIPKLDPSGETIVLLIDELPEVLHNLHKKGQNDIALAIATAIVSYKKEYFGEGADANDGKDDYKPVKGDIKPVKDAPNPKTETSQNPNKSSELIKSDLTYKIQLSVSSKKMALTSKNFMGLSDITMIKDGKFYKYFYSNTSNADQIKLQLNEARAKGYKSAYVVSFKNGIKLN